MKNATEMNKRAFLVMAAQYVVVWAAIYYLINVLSSHSANSLLYATISAWWCAAYFCLLVDVKLAVTLYVALIFVAIEIFLFGRISLICPMYS